MTPILLPALALVIALATLAWAVTRRRSSRRREDEQAARIVALTTRVRELEEQSRPIPGTGRGGKAWTVTVGGRELDVKALPPAEWAKAMQDLPDFLFSYAVAKAEQKGEMNPEELERLTASARAWLQASLVDGEGVRLDQLTVPEAMDAVVRISRLNGLDENLAAWFRGRLDPDDPRARRDREKVREQAQRSARPPN